jgi:hypothetical protein
MSESVQAENELFYPKADGTPRVFHFALMGATDPQEAGLELQNDLNDLKRHGYTTFHQIVPCGYHASAVTNGVRKGIVGHRQENFQVLSAVVVIAS